MKKVIAAVMALLAAVSLFGCRKEAAQEFTGPNYKFDRALIKTPYESVIEVEIEAIWSWDDTAYTITAKDGTRYLVSSENCLLIKDNK